LYQWQAVNEDGYVIAVFAFAFNADLVRYLKFISAPFIAVEKADINGFGGFSVCCFTFEGISVAEYFGAFND
jgi:hypothetical protein